MNDNKEDDEKQMKKMNKEAENVIKCIGLYPNIDQHYKSNLLHFQKMISRIKF